MAKYECNLIGDFNGLLSSITEGILRGSVSASLEACSDVAMDDTLCAVRVFERYSVIGKNRLSLHVVLLGKGERLFLSAVASGGSSAVFFKVNTFGEEAFLRRLEDIVERYRRGA